MNKERMKQLAASISDEPRRFDMFEWGYIIAQGDKKLKAAVGASRIHHMIETGI